MNLNVGVGCRTTTNPLCLDTVQADFDKTWKGVDVCCDLAHLPFINDAFNNVYCFHTLEHLPNPVEGLKELIRVCTDIVELEVPHRFSKQAKQPNHTCNFKTGWFRACLKNYAYCLKTPWDFPRHIGIHVWIYPHLHRSSCVPEEHPRGALDLA